MRRMIVALLGVAGLSAVPCAIAAAPSFGAYAVAVGHGKPAHTIDWSSDPDAKRFRGALRRGYAKGVRFGGHYAVASWGCGMDCRVMAIIDLGDGRVSFGPGAEMDYEFHPDSRLLIANSPDAVRQSLRDAGACPDKADEWSVISHYYEWTGKRFKHLQDVDLCARKAAVGNGHK